MTSAKKKCTRCRLVKRLDGFRTRKSGAPLAWCRTCYAEVHREYNRFYYQREKARFRRHRKRRMDEMREYIARLKHGKACAECRREFPYFLLEFDHVRGAKLFRLSNAQTILSARRVKEELAKCEIVCVNCHRRRSFVRLCLMRGGVFIGRQRVNAAALVRALKIRSRCEDCSLRYPYFVLEFDHVAEKSVAISRLSNRALSIEEVSREIAACEVVCATCHRERTFRRRWERGDQTLLDLWKRLGIGMVGLKRVVG